MTMQARPQCRRKLSADQIRSLRAMRLQGLTMRDLARFFQISQSAVQHIISYSTYKNIR